MNAYTVTGFEGIWMNLTAAVVVANSPEEAAEMLKAKLQERCIDAYILPEQMKPLPMNAPEVVLLADGDY